jgi:hypothetical protein
MIINQYKINEKKIYEEHKKMEKMRLIKTSNAFHGGLWGNPYISIKLDNQLETSASASTHPSYNAFNNVQIDENKDVKRRSDWNVSFNQLFNFFEAK